MKQINSVTDLKTIKTQTIQTQNHRDANYDCFWIIDSDGSVTLAFLNSKKSVCLEAGWGF